MSAPISRSKTPLRLLTAALVLSAATLTHACGGGGGGGGGQGGGGGGLAGGGGTAGTAGGATTAAAGLVTTSAGLAVPQVQQQAVIFNQMVAAQELRRQQVNAFAAARFAHFVQLRRAIRAQRQAEPIRGETTFAARRGSSPAPIRLASDSVDSSRPRITVFGRS